MPCWLDALLQHLYQLPVCTHTTNPALPHPTTYVHAAARGGPFYVAVHAVLLLALLQGANTDTCTTNTIPTAAPGAASVSGSGVSVVTGPFGLATPPPWSVTRDDKGVSLFGTARVGGITAFSDVGSFGPGLAGLQVQYYAGGASSQAAQGHHGAAVGQLPSTNGLPREVVDLPDLNGTVVQVFVYTTAASGSSSTGSNGADGATLAGLELQTLSGHTYFTHTRLKEAAAALSGGGGNSGSSRLTRHNATPCPAPGQLPLRLAYLRTRSDAKTIYSLTFSWTSFVPRESGTWHVHAKYIRARGLLGYRRWREVCLCERI